MTLDEMPLGGRPARIALTLSIVRQCAAQLDIAHETGRVHGSVTPSRIFVFELDEETAHAEIKDFGMARQQQEKVVAGLATAETSAYLSPEEILGNAPDARSDQFSLAVITYELLTGQKPFTAKVISELFFEICTSTPVSPERLNPEVTSAAAAVLLRALAKEPAERFRSCSTFASQLVEAMKASPAATQASAGLAGLPLAMATTVADAADAVSHEPEAPATDVEPEELPAVVEPAIAARTDLPAKVRPGEAAMGGTEEETVHSAEVPESAAAAKADVAAERMGAAAGAPPPVKPIVQFHPQPASYELPSARRRLYPEDREPRSAASRTTSSLIRFGLLLLAIVAIVGLGSRFISWRPKPSLPQQVLDSKNAPVTPAPDITQPQGPDSDTPSKTAGPDDLTDTQPTPPPTRRRGRNGRVATNPIRTPDPSLAATSPGLTAANRGRADASTGRSMAVVGLYTTPSGARMVVDDRPEMSCTSPCTLMLPSGRHALSAQMVGYTVARRIFNSPGDKSVVIALNQSVGTLLVTSDPAGATLQVDGHDAGRTPAHLRLSAGQHRLDAFFGAQAKQKLVDIQPDTIQSTGFDLRSH